MTPKSIQNSTGPVGIKDPVIAICRSAQKYACFDGSRVVKAYTFYPVEHRAIEFGKKWLAKRTNKQPRVVIVGHRQIFGANKKRKQREIPKEQRELLRAITVASRQNE
jgi:hypothetical protein